VVRGGGPSSRSRSRSRRRRLLWWSATTDVTARNKPLLIVGKNTSHRHRFQSLRRLFFFGSVFLGFFGFVRPVEESPASRCKVLNGRNNGGAVKILKGGNGCTVRLSKPRVHDPCVSSRSVEESWCDRFKQFVHACGVVNELSRSVARREVICLCHRHHLIGQSPRFFGFRHRRCDLFMFDE